MKIADESLARLTELLRHGALNAAEIAERLDISKPTAYAWIRALMGRSGRVIAAYSRAQTGPGPRALFYRLKR